MNNGRNGDNMWDEPLPSSESETNIFPMKINQ